MAKNLYQILFKYEILNLKGNWEARNLQFFEFANTAEEAFNNTWKKSWNDDIEVIRNPNSKTIRNVLDGKAYCVLVTNLSEISLPIPTCDHFYITNGVFPVDINPKLKIRPSRLIHTDKEAQQHEYL